MTDSFEDALCPYDAYPDTGGDHADHQSRLDSDIRIGALTAGPATGWLPPGVEGFRSPRS